jgi:hypothetical protein
MYLQLAENSTDMYQPIETNQGTLYVRPDLLSAAGLKPGAMAIQQSLKPAAGQLVKKAAPALIKTGIKAVPGGGAAGVALDIIKKGAQAIKAKRDAKKSETAAADQAAAAAASAAAIETDKASKRNKMLLIGGGILAAGALIYLITKKK